MYPLRPPDLRLIQDFIYSKYNADFLSVPLISNESTLSKVKPELPEIGGSENTKKSCINVHKPTKKKHSG